MRPELSHWFWYEKFSVLLLKECTLLEFMPPERKQKISDLLKQISYEIAGGLRYKVEEAKKIIDTGENPQESIENSEINTEAAEKLRKLAL